MTNVGSPSEGVSGTLSGLPCLLLGGALLLFAGVATLALLPPLLGLLLPPMPPVPEGAHLKTTTTRGYGADTWEYALAMPICEVVAFYTAHGGTCEAACDLPYDTPAAQCVGRLPMTAFAALWQAQLTAETHQRTRLLLAREVNWAGNTFPDESLWQAQLTPAAR